MLKCQGSEKELEMAQYEPFCSAKEDQQLTLRGIEAVPKCLETTEELEIAQNEPICSAQEDQQQLPVPKCQGPAEEPLTSEYEVIERPETPGSFRIKGNARNVPSHLRRYRVNETLVLD